MTNSLNAFGYFAPTIISSLGFSGCGCFILSWERKLISRASATSDGATQCFCICRHHRQFVAF